MSTLNHAAAANVAARRRAQTSLAGVRLSVDADEFLRLLAEVDDPIVATWTLGWGIRVLTFHNYVFHYEGFAVFTSSREALAIPEHVQIIRAKGVR